MDPVETFRHFAESTASTPGRSKLDPHLDAILLLRKRRKSYAFIAEALEREAGVKVTPSTIFSFLKVRKKRRQEEEPAPSLKKPPLPTAQQPGPPRRFNIDA